MSQYRKNSAPNAESAKYQKAGQGPGDRVNDSKENEVEGSGVVYLETGDGSEDGDERVRSIKTNIKVGSCVISVVVVVVGIVILAMSGKGQVKGRNQLDYDYYSAASYLKMPITEKHPCNKDCSACPNTKKCDNTGPMKCVQYSFLWQSPDKTKKCSSCERDAEESGIQCNKKGKAIGCKEDHFFHPSTDLGTEFKKGDRGGCIRCHQNATKCNDKGNKKCMKGWYLGLQNDFGYLTCIECPEGAKKCKDKQGPISCNVGYAYEAMNDDYGSCRKCKKNAIECDDSGATRCEDGFYVPSTTITYRKECKKCHNSLATKCDEDQDFSCQNLGVFVWESTFLNSSKRCEKCIDNLSNCGRCSNSKTCTQCLPDPSTSFIKLNSQNQCECSILNSQFNKNTQKCECDSNLILADNMCIMCEVKFAGCLKCNDNQCALCDFENGFYISEETRKCQKCETTIENCAKCSSATSCMNCKTGFNLDSVGNCV